MTAPTIPSPSATENRIVKKLKAGIALMEAKTLAALSVSGVSATSSPGAILAQLVAHPPQTLRSIAWNAAQARIAFKLTMKQVQADLSESMAYGNHLRSVASYLDGSLDMLPESIPADLKLLARTAKAGLLAGLIDTSLPSVIRKRADQGLSRLEAVSARVDKILSASRVARLSASKRLYERCAKAEDLTDAERSRAKSLISFLNRHLAKAKSGHQRNFFVKRT